MGRKAKNNIAKATSLTESNIRMNFLYQASNLLATISKEIQSNDNSTIKKFKADRKKKAENIKNNSVKKVDDEKIVKKKKRVPLRLKRNKHISDLYKDKIENDSKNTNAMDIDKITNNTSMELQNKKLNAITNNNYPLLPLSRYYSTTLNIVAQKTVSRMDPNVKRSICKCCKTPLIPGLTSNIEIDDNETKYAIECKSCHTKREFKSDNPDYCLFTEKAALTTEVYEQYLDVLSKENKKGKGKQ